MAFYYFDTQWRDGQCRWSLLDLRELARDGFGRQRGLQLKVP
jgi:hypothetical protein